jgi:hypothetical protein
MDKYIPYVKFYRNATPILEGEGRLIKTHEPYYSVYKKAIYVVRDPRNCALSAHARLLELKIVDPSLDTFIPWFLRGGPYGHGSWAAHIRSWMDGPLAKQGKLLVVKFEDLRKSPEEWVGKMVEFLGFPLDMEKVRLAVANNSIERMQVKEKQSKTLFQGETEEGRFVRKGSTSGWKDKMTPEHLHLFEKYAGKEMARLGYTISVSDLRVKEPQVAVR